MQIWKVLDKNRAEIVRKAAAALKKGKILACPSDTVYGLLADATNKRAVQNIFQIKGRKKGKPPPIFVKDIAMAKSLAKISSKQGVLLKRSWPGKVTYVLESKGALPEETGTQKRIGLRIPCYVLLKELLQKVRKPLTGTSANLAGERPLRDSKEILRQFQKRKYRPDILLDAGKLPFSKPSMVIDIIGKKPIILRK